MTRLGARALAPAALVLTACGKAPELPVTPGWMSFQPDGVGLQALTLPGTHDSMAMYEDLKDTAQTQSLPLVEQYDAGIRYVDMRCRNVMDAFEMYHGTVDELATFDDVLATTYAFLDEYPTETIAMSIKEETGSGTTSETFDQVAAGYIAKDADRWYTGDSIPALGDVRGKIVLVRRYDTAQTPMGIDGSQWADDTTFTLTTPDATLTIEDNYVSVDPMTDKWPDILALFGEARAGSASTWYLAYTSGYITEPDQLPDIEAVSDVVNPLLDAYLTAPANTRAHLGAVVMDFATRDRVAEVTALDALTR